MSDAISRSALQEATLRLLTIGKWADGHLELRPTLTAQELDRLLTDAPALDAVPVVRCKECCYLAKDGESLYCTYHDNINVTEEFFCATGEVEHADARKPV